MAGNWIKFDTSTSDKPEVWEIATKLGIDPDAVVGKLLRVWTWFDDHTEKGNAKGNAPSVTKALLDRRVCVTGFVTAMIEVGWLEETDGMLSLPNFDRHNGQTAKNRALTAKRVSLHKKSNASVTIGNEKSNAASVTSALPREEKRREDINTKGVPPSGDEKPKAKRQKKPLAVFDASSIPAALQTDGFPAAWERWLIYRRDLGKPVLASSVDAIFEKSASIGAASAAAKFQHAIAQGWQGWDFGDTSQAATTAKPPEQTAKPDEFALMAEAYRATRKQREVPQ